MAKKSTTECALGGMVDSYNSMYKDPKAYAESTYAAQLKSIGRAEGRNTKTSTLDKTVKPWPLDHIPG